MSDHIKVRPAVINDTIQMAAILNEIISVGGTTAFEDSVSAGDMESWYVSAALFCHVALDDAGQIAGFQSVEHTDAYGPGIGEISTFARQTPVLRGVGTALFQATKQVAIDIGLSEINAKIRADNAPGLAYYSKIGFQDHSVLPGIPLKDGTKVDRILKRYGLL